MKIYLDNNATTKVDDSILEEIKKIYSEDYGNPSSIHSLGEKAKEILENSRKIIAKKIKAKVSEIIFTSGGSESNNLAIKGLAQANPNKKHIISSKIEHPSILETLKSLKDYKIDLISVNEEGKINIQELENKISKNTLLVSIMHANNEVGTIQDLETIGKICKKNKVYFHSDIVQTFGKEDVNVEKQNLDLASISGHKIHTPKGIGALYIKNNIKIRKQIDGGNHEFKQRAGTQNIAGARALALATKILTKKDKERIRHLREYLTCRILAEIKDTKLNGSKDRIFNTSNIGFKNIEGEAILKLLSDKKIYVSTASACSSDKLEPSHVLIAMGIKHKDAHGAIRFSLSKYTTKEEIDSTIINLKKVIRNLRNISPYK